MNSGRHHDNSQTFKSQKNSLNVVEIVPGEESTIQTFQQTLHNTFGSINNHDSARSQFLINHPSNITNVYDMLSQFLMPTMDQTNNKLNINNHANNAYPQQFRFSAPSSMQTQIQLPMQNQGQSVQTPLPANNYNFNNFVFSNELNHGVKTTEQPQEKRKIVSAKKTVKKPSANSNQNSSPQKAASVQGNSTGNINRQLMGQNQNNNTNTQKESYITQAINNNDLRKIILLLKQTTDKQTFERLFNSNISIKKWLLGEFKIDDPAFDDFRTGELFMNALNLRANTADLLCWLSTNKKFTERQFSDIDANDPGSRYFRAKLSQYIGGFATQVLQGSDKDFLQYLITLLHDTKFINELLDAFLAKSTSSEISDDYRRRLLNVYDIIRQTNDFSFDAITDKNLTMELPNTPFDYVKAENGKDESNRIHIEHHTYRSFS